MSFYDDDNDEFDHEGERVQHLDLTGRAQTMDLTQPTIGVNRPALDLSTPRMDLTAQPVPSNTVDLTQPQPAPQMDLTGIMPPANTLNLAVETEPSTGLAKKTFDFAFNRFGDSLENQLEEFRDKVAEEIEDLEMVDRHELVRVEVYYRP